MGGELLETVKQLLRRSAKYIVDLVNLIHLVSSREERKQTEHFKKHAADTPQVHL